MLVMTNHMNLNPMGLLVTSEEFLSSGPGSITIPAVSFAVLRGSPSAAQRFLDRQLDAVARGRPHAQVPLTELLYHCLREHPQDICLINGTSGDEFTNDQILRRAVSIARALTARGARGTPIMCVMRNTERLVSLYYGCMFAGAVPFLLDPLSTPGELKHFLNLVVPSLVVCDEDRLEAARAAVEEYGALSHSDVIVDLSEFAAEHDNDPAGFTPVSVAPNACGVLLPTSGSTGLPKAAQINYDALLIQLPTLWTHHSQFPRPTERLMFMSTAQWMTFTNFLTTCPVYRITIVVTPDKTIPTVLRVIQTVKPTWLLLVPGTAAALADAATAEQLTSLQNVLITGAAPSLAAMKRLQQLAPSAHVANSYGMTEASGFAAVATRSTPLLSIGQIANTFEYKLADENGKTVPRGEKGELLLKSDCIIKKYLKNEEAYAESVAADGWWKTGDVFTEDEDHQLDFVERKKFWFKYFNYQISPEELEAVINSVAGVQEAVVVGTEQGAAAAVVRRPGAAVTKEDIHHAINSALIEYKRLRGGVAFVDSLPRTHSGKLHRSDCTKFLNKLVEQGECC